MQFKNELWIGVADQAEVTQKKKKGWFSFASSAVGNWKLVFTQEQFNTPVQLICPKAMLQNPAGMSVPRWAQTTTVIHQT